MAEKKNKKKGGSGKFFLGAALGAIAGAVAGKFFSEPEGKCKCGDDCNCKKTATKKPAAKKTTKKTTTKAKK